MKDLLIIGAGGFGREVLQWIKDINKQKLTRNSIGFIDDNLNALDNLKCDYKVVGTINDSMEKRVLLVANNVTSILNTMQWNWQNSTG